MKSKTSSPLHQQRQPARKPATAEPMVLYEAISQLRSWLTIPVRAAKAKLSALLDRVCQASDFIGLPLVPRAATN